MSSNFIFNNFGAALEIEIDADNQAKCPECSCKFKQIIQHLRKNANCKSRIENFDIFKHEYQMFTNRRKQIVHRKRKLEANAESLYEVEAKEKRSHFHIMHLKLK